MNTNKHTKQIGERLSFLRTQAGLTVEDVATLLSTSPIRYTKLENGERMARKDEELQVDEVVKLCNRYGIGIDDFMGISQNTELEGLLDALTSKDREIISGIAQTFKFQEVRPMKDILLSLS